MSDSTMTTIITGDPTEHFLSSDWLTAGSPASVEIRDFNNIDDSVWYSNDVITNVVFGVGVNALIGHPFYNCPNLVSVHIGPDVSTIDQGFAVSSSILTTITVDSTNPYFHVDNLGILYKKAVGNDTHTMIQYPFGTGRTLSIPLAVEHIAPYFAYGHTSSDSLETVFFFNDSSVETIGAYAFANNDFTSIEFPNSITSIASTAFHRCYALATVFILQTTADALSASGAIVIIPSTTTFRGTTHDVSIELLILPACFPAGTLIDADQGLIAIERLRPGVHTFGGRRLEGVSRTNPYERHLVQLERNSLCAGVPSTTIRLSAAHRVWFRGRMRRAGNLLFRSGVSLRLHDGGLLFNVLLPQYGAVRVADMVCETLHPMHPAAAVARARIRTRTRSVSRV